MLWGVMYSCLMSAVCAVLLLFFSFAECLVDIMAAYKKEKDMSTGKTEVLVQSFIFVFTFICGSLLGSYL